MIIQKEKGKKEKKENSRNDLYSRKNASGQTNQKKKIKKSHKEKERETHCSRIIEHLILSTIIDDLRS